MHTINGIHICDNTFRASDLDVTIELNSEKVSFPEDYGVMDISEWIRQ